MHPVAPRNVNDISCVWTVKHECRSSIVFCIAEVARRNVLDASRVATIKRASTGWHFAVLCNSLLYCVVRSSNFLCFVVLE